MTDNRIVSMEGRPEESGPGTRAIGRAGFTSALHAQGNRPAPEALHARLFRDKIS
jgi:hypothetical protein